MKNIMQNYINKLWVILVISLAAFSACKKDATNVLFKGGTAPVLTSSVTDSIPLMFTNANNPAITFNWTNPNYQFSNGTSSLNVTYNLQFDTVGANFTSPKMQTVQISPALSKTFTVNDLNSILGNGLQLDTSHTHNVEVRVVSFLAPYTSGSPNLVSLSSNSLKYKVKPFAPPPVVTPPDPSAVLVLVGGDAKLGGWSNPVPASQQFTRVSATDYQLKIELSGGDPTNGSDQYLILPVNGSWSHKYACKKTSDQPFSGGSFGLDLSDNFPGPTAPGVYLFDLNFQTGILTVTKQ
jgi:starch-binding outer membrane protein SusE/F